MICLSIETSCDDTSVALVDDIKGILGGFTVSQIANHSEHGGVVPELASRKHEENIVSCTQKALSESGLDISEVDIVAVTVRPGLSGPLLVGVSFAKGISMGLDVPIVGVDHVEAHAISAVLENQKLSPPFLSLVASGGHTSIIDVERYDQFSVCAKTRDDAVGEILDKIARSMGISYPGGAVLDSMAIKGNKNILSIPRPRLDNLDFSFSGIKTWALNTVRKLKENEKNDFASSLMFGLSDYISNNLIQIALSKRRKNIALGGGVSSSKVLKLVLKRKCEEYGLKLYTSNSKYCVDNAYMIGVLGIYNFRNNRILNIDIL